jgi:hypothetical protein
MGGRRDAGDLLDRVFAALADAPPGLHDVAPPADEIPVGLPEPLIELYGHCDGARVYVDALELEPADGVALDETTARWRFATLDGDAVALDARGRVWRYDASIDDDVLVGTRLDRWLAGAIDALAVVYDEAGEFKDDVFDDAGELVPAAREQQLRAQLRRDPAAAGPRWQLAHVLVSRGADESARDELEQAVSDEPAFAWAWLDLARRSEQLGELGGALDEARMAAEAAEAASHAQAGYFWSHVARLASRTGDELARAEAATKVSLLAPALKRAQLDGVRERLDAGDPASARGLVELLRAVWPRDVEVLDAAKRVGR